MPYPASRPHTDQHIKIQGLKYARGQRHARRTRSSCTMALRSAWGRRRALTKRDIPARNAPCGTLPKLPERTRSHVTWMEACPPQCRCHSPAGVLAISSLFLTLCLIWPRCPVAARGTIAPSTCPFDLRERHHRRAARREESARRAGPSLPQGAHSAGRPLAAFRVEPQARRHARGGGGAAGGTRGRSARCPRGRAHLPLRAQQPRVRPAARRPRRRCSRRRSGLRPAGAVPARGSSSVSLARK